MALAFLNGARTKPEQLIAIDLGGRVTKAVQMRCNGKCKLSSYALVDAPIYEKSLPPDLLAEHLKAVCQALGTKVRGVALAVGVNESMVRHVDLPMMPVADMRQVLKTSPKNYLQQELPGHVFDCFVMPGPAKAPNAGEKGSGGVSKMKVLAAGARQQLVQDIQAAVRGAGLVAESIVPGLIGPVNAFEAAMPDVFANQSVALVDLGFRSTSICLLQKGELLLSRVVAIGGDRLTTGLAESLGISYAEAESIKLGIPGEVQAQLQALLLPLSRELRTSIDFFEHQQDTTVSQIFVSGGTSRSEFIVQTLQAELMAECKSWNPTTFMENALPKPQADELEQVAPQLAVAIGAAMATF